MRHGYVVFYQNMPLAICESLAAAEDYLTEEKKRDLQPNLDTDLYYTLVPFAPRRARRPVSHPTARNLTGD